MVLIEVFQVDHLKRELQAASVLLESERTQAAREIARWKAKISSSASAPAAASASPAAVRRSPSSSHPNPNPSPNPNSAVSDLRRRLAEVEMQLRMERFKNGHSLGGGRDTRTSPSVRSPSRLRGTSVTGMPLYQQSALPSRGAARASPSLLVGGNLTRRSLSADSALALGRLGQRLPPRPRTPTPSRALSGRFTPSAASPQQT